MRMFEAVRDGRNDPTAIHDCMIVEHYIIVRDEEGQTFELAVPHILPPSHDGKDLSLARKESIAFFRSYMEDNNVSEVPESD